MPKPVVTLATCSSLPRLEEDEAGLPDALAQRGVDPRIAVWDDPDVDWSRAGVVVMRAVHDYAPRRAEFIRWAESVPRLLNHPDVVRWNTDKHYMLELEKYGMPVIPTLWLEPAQKLSKRQVHTRFPALGDFVVKPAVSSGSRGVGRYTGTSPQSRMAAISHAMELLSAGQTVMVQRYLESVDQRGETALIFMNGLVSHAVEKAPMLHGPFRSSDEAPREVAHAREATEAEWRMGEAVRSAVHGYIKSRLGRDEVLLYCRVDLVESDKPDDYRVLEVSLVDASLYLGSTPGALENFADAIAARAFW